MVREKTFQIKLMVDAYDHGDIIDAIINGSDPRASRDEAEIILQSMLETDRAGIALMTTPSWDNVYPGNPMVEGRQMFGEFYRPGTRKRNSAITIRRGNVRSFRKQFEYQLSISPEGSALVYHALCNPDDNLRCRDLVRVRAGIWRLTAERSPWVETMYGVTEEYSIKITYPDERLIQYRGVLRWRSWTGRIDRVKRYDDFWSIYVWFKLSPDTSTEVRDEFFMDLMDEVLKILGYYGRSSKTPTGDEYKVDTQAIVDHWNKGRFFVHETGSKISTPDGDEEDRELDFFIEQTTERNDDGEWEQLLNMATVKSSKTGAFRKAKLG